MHSAIVVVRMPLDAYPGRQQWQTFCAAVASLDTNDAAKRLGENVWQIAFQKNPGALALLVYSCDRHGLSYGILPFDAEPQWLPAGFDPKPT
jgi:hypothetical protein